jgi:hypothetical protein
MFLFLVGLFVFFTLITKLKNIFSITRSFWVTSEFRLFRTYITTRRGGAYHFILPCFIRFCLPLPSCSCSWYVYPRSILSHSLRMDLHLSIFYLISFSVGNYSPKLLYFVELTTENDSLGLLISGLFKLSVCNIIN